jgi:hypothetical protein
MRSIFRNVLAGLVAVFAISAVGVSPASAALPEFEGPVSAEHPLKYTVSIPEIEFSGGGTEIRCSSGTGEGAFTNTKTGTFSATFTHCIWNFTGGCTSKGANLKELKTEPSIPASLVYISKEKKEVGILLNRTNKSERESVFMAEFKCSSSVVGPMVGSLLLPVTPDNTKTKVYKLEIRKSNPREYEYENKKPKTEFEWKPICCQYTELRVEAGGFSHSAELITAINTEIKA